MKRIMFGGILFWLCAGLVSAEETTDYAKLFEEAATDNVIQLPGYELTSELDVSLGLKYRFNITSEITVSNCNEDYTTCSINIEGDNKTYNLNFSWQTKPEKIDYEKIFDSAKTDGVIKMDSIAPTTNEELELYLTLKVRTYLGMSDVSCNDDYTACTFQLSYYDELNSDAVYNLNFSWKKADTNIKSLIDKYKEKIINEGEKEEPKLPFRNSSLPIFKLTNLELINYYYYSNEDEDTDYINLNNMNYISKLRDIVDNNKITFKFSAYLGDGDDFFNYGSGYLFLYYDGVLYGYIGTSDDEEEISYIIDHVLYIPEDTENTPEAFVKAAKKIIDDYLGNSDAIVEVGGLRSNYTNLIIDYYEYGDESKMTDYYYKITIKNNTNDFLIIKDASASQKSNIELKNYQYNISITTSKAIPLDTILNVVSIDKSSSHYSNIMKKLGLSEKSVFMMYDLIPKSNDNAGYKYTLSNGTFKISIPLKEELKNKKLAAYYVSDDGKIEKYPVTVENGFAVFETKHLSIYTVAEDKDISSLETVPKTGDKIVLYVVTALLSITAIILLISKFRKKSKV